MVKLLIKTEGINSPGLELRPGVNQVGRTPENHLQIDHPTVSSLHCEVVLTDNALMVRDCNSTNGIYVNGLRVTEAALRPGETFLVGDVELLVETTEFRVAIPHFDKSRQTPPMMLPDGALLCPRHPEARATYKCTRCHEVMCDGCVHHLRRHGGKTFSLCPVCSSPCEWLGVGPPKKKSLFEQIKHTVIETFTPDKPREE